MDWLLTGYDYGTNVTIPPWGPPTTRPEEQEAYDEEDIRALVHMHMMSDEEEQESYEPEQDSWQISHLVSADTFGASHDTGNVWTGRMKIMWQPLACGLYPG